MVMNWSQDMNLPPHVGQGLEQFGQQLHDELGDRVSSIVLYGGLAKGEYASHSSDVNVMVVLKEVTEDVLDKLVAPVQQGMRDFRLAVMVLSEHDLHTSTDAFPVKFLDIQHHHHILWGADVLTDLTIAEAHLRLRCEQEVKNLLLRLRQFYLRRAHFPELIENTLTRSISSFLTDMAVVLQLKTGQTPIDKPAIAEAIAQELDLDHQVLQDVLALKSGTYKPESAELKHLYSAFMGVVQKAADAVDQL